ncbi:MAG: tetratricopeptide repeat protein [Kiritimatiellia bacterium]
MKIMSWLAVFLACGIMSSGAAEYFVNKQGDDANAGTARDKAFLTIQKGVDALATGDTLSIGPGEYFESVCRTNLGGAGADTIIRSEVPGAAILRGDTPAPEFKKVEGYRFVYSAPFDNKPKSVLEHNKLLVMFPKANAAELEFGPGFYSYDTNSKTLYISNPDLVAPDQRRYSVSVKGLHGLELTSPRRVIIEGLAASGYGAGWGMLLLTPDSCVIRDCVAYLNEGGFNLCPTNGMGGNGGSNNLVEGCVCYGNSFGGIARYGANNDTIRNCHLYRNYRENNEHFGIIHYASMTGPLIMTNNISWGHNFNYSVKPGGQQERLDHNVALGFIRIRNMYNNIVAGGNEYRGESAQTPDNILFQREEKLDRDFEFADPLNLDFRLQPDSRFRGTAPDKSDRGPYPYQANIFYVTPSGDDAADGLSMRKPWKTLERAFKGLKPGDTLYVAEGEYAAAPLNKLGDGKAMIRICGRARGTVVIAGKQSVNGGAGIIFERINFAGGLSLSGTRSVEVKNCTFYGAAEGLTAEGVKDLKIKHSVFAGVPLDLKQSSGVILSGNLYANSGQPAVRLDDADAIRYSDYNNCCDKAKCWQVGRVVMTLAEVQKNQEQHSQSMAAELIAEKGVPRLKEEARFKSSGPNNTSVGIHHEYEPVTDVRDLVGPFLHSVNDTTANIEWWSSHPAKYNLAWGEAGGTTNVINGFSGPERFNTFSLTNLAPGKAYHFNIRSVNTFSLYGENEPPALKPENARLSFTTAVAAAEAKVYYVAPDGSDAGTGLGRDKAFLTVNRAATMLKPGDTVMIAGGNYNETVRVRTAGTKERPITFRSIAGEKPYFKGENLSLVFQIISKPDIKLDGLYFDAGFWDKVIVARQSPRLQITRCLNAMIGAEGCPGTLIRNCIVRGGWSGAGLGGSPDSLVENNVFIMTILRHLSCSDQSTVARNNIFCECIRGKAHQTLVELPSKPAESNNCFYLRWPEDEKLAINWRPLTEYRLRTGSDALYANPMMPGTPGWSQGWQQSRINDFPDCFAANPELIKRGIGLKPEAFSGFSFSNKWVYDAKWADAVIAATNAAWALVKAGKDAEAITAYTNLAATLPMCDRLKSEIFEQASLCADRLKDLSRAMQLATNIPVQAVAMRRQMQVMLEQKDYAGITNKFSSRALGGRAFHLSFAYPEQEDLMADLFYCRSIAWRETGNLAAAEADLKVMNEKRMQLSYRSGESIHDLVWLRLGDFYRDTLKDDDRAYAAYTNITDRTAWVPWLGRPRKPAARGADETLVAATKAASDILLKRGKDKEVAQLQYNLVLAQAEAAAAMLKETETIAKFKEIMALQGKSTPGIETCEKRINAFEDAVRTNVVKGIGELSAGLLNDTRDLLVKTACAADANNRSVALRSLLMFAPPDKVNELLDKIEADLKKKSIQAQLEPAVKRLRELSQGHKWQEILDQFKDADFSAWQDNELAGEAFNIRGTAYFNLKMPEKAESDLIKGLEKKPGDLIACYLLAENYRENLKNEDKALAAYQKLVGQGSWYMPVDATLKTAEILRARNKNEEALKALESLNFEVADGSWREKKYSSLEKTLVALNRKNDAIAKYQKALALNDLTPAEKTEFEKRINALRGDSAQAVQK